MGYTSGTGSFSLQFTAGRAEVGLLADGLELLEYSYNVLACQSWYADGYLTGNGLRGLEKSVLARQMLGAARANCALRHLLPDAASMTVVSLQMSSPISGNFKGIGEEARKL